MLGGTSTAAPEQSKAHAGVAYAAKHTLQVYFTTSAGQNGMLGTDLSRSDRSGVLLYTLQVCGC
jgi:hypothetical protein